MTPRYVAMWKKCYERTFRVALVSLDADNNQRAKELASGLDRDTAERLACEEAELRNIDVHVACKCVATYQFGRCTCDDDGACDRN